jgi:hypothetical protein
MCCVEEKERRVETARNVRDQDGLHRYLKSKVSRAQMLAASGTALALAAVPRAVGAQATPPSGRLEFPYSPQVQGTYTPEAILDILGIMDAYERALVTYHTYALTTAQLGLTGLTLSMAQATLAIAQSHDDLLVSLGARSRTDTLSPLTKPTAANIIAARESDAILLVAGYMAAAREFAELGQPLLVKYAYQLGATWAEMRALARTVPASAGVAGYTPPNNKAFETDHFVYVRDLYSLLASLGIVENPGVGRSGLRLTYPGRDAALAAAGPMATSVIQRRPNNAIVSTSIHNTTAQGLVGERGDTP